MNNIFLEQPRRGKTRDSAINPIQAERSMGLDKAVRFGLREQR